MTKSLLKIPMKVNKRYIFLFSLILFIFLNQCSNKSKKQLYIDKYYGNVLLNDVIPLKYQYLKNFDILQLKDSSYCIVKSSDFIMLISGDSNIIFERVDNSSNELSLKINKGFMAIYSKKIFKNAQIQATNASVMGDFKYMVIMTDNDTSCISCIDGKLNVNYYVGNYKYSKSIVSKNQFLIAGSKTEYGAIPMYLLQDYESMAALFYVDNKHDDIAQQFLHDKLLRFSYINFKEEIELAMMAQQKGQLTKVVTTSGTVYKGWVLAKGNLLEIISINGSIEIPQKRVKYVLHYSPMYYRDD